MRLTMVSTLGTGSRAYADLKPDPRKKNSNRTEVRVRALSFSADRCPIEPSIVVPPFGLLASCRGCCTPGAVRGKSWVRALPAPALRIYGRGPQVVGRQTDYGLAVRCFP